MPLVIEKPTHKSRLVLCNMIPPECSLTLQGILFLRIRVASCEHRVTNPDHESMRLYI